MGLIFESVKADVWAELYGLENTKWGASQSNQRCRRSSEKPALLVRLCCLLRCCNSYVYFCSIMCSVLCFCLFLCSPTVLLKLCQIQHKPEPQVFFCTSPLPPVPSGVVLGACKKGQWCLQLLLGPINTANPIGIVIEIGFLVRESLESFQRSASSQ